eukprot:6659673-Alexandrium_andersonii.AAC.1
MSASLVGSEMCIRDRPQRRLHQRHRRREVAVGPGAAAAAAAHAPARKGCLLYTSDAADDM